MADRLIRNRDGFRPGCRIGELATECYFTTCVTILLATGGLKLLAIIMNGRQAALLDPLFLVDSNYVLTGVAIVEIVIALFVYKLRSDILKALLLLWLAGNFVLYRIGLNMISWDESCRCFGSVINLIPVRKQTLDWLSLALLACMVAGSLVVIVNWLIARHRREKPCFNCNGNART